MNNNVLLWHQILLTCRFHLLVWEQQEKRINLGQVKIHLHFTMTNPPWSAIVTLTALGLRTFSSDF